MPATVALHREMVLTHQKTWDHVWKLREFGVIEPTADLIEGANALFKVSEKLRTALLADGIKVQDYDDIQESKG